MKFDIYEHVTTEIVEGLKKGVVAWRKPWEDGLPKNLKTKKTYRGINLLLLYVAKQRYGFKSNYWVTFKQAQELKGHVRKGEKSHIITFFEFKEKEKIIVNDYGEDEKKIEKYPLLRYYRVFNLEQTDGIEIKEEKLDFNRIKKCERVIKGYETKPRIIHGFNKASYNPGEDTVKMPNKKDFESEEEYYSTLFHELIHSTGHKNRLNREGITKQNSFGSQEYSKEELVAEIGTCFLNAHTGIKGKTFNNNVAYINNWIKALEKDKRLIFRLAGKSQQATDHILNLSPGSFLNHSNSEKH